MGTDRAVTLVVTSCGRYDLLARTLESLYKYCDYPFAEVIVAEDWEREGQVKNIDRAYARVRTKYIFACEDDWEFYRSDFMDYSLDILEQYPSVLQVWLRAHNDTNGHPLRYDYDPGFPILDPNWSTGWRGFSWNPGLRRLSDWKGIGGYMKHWQEIDNKTERYLSGYYAEIGLVAAILPEAGGYVRHIGGGRTTQK
jgi:hypothetical protein